MLDPSIVAIARSKIHLMFVSVPRYWLSSGPQLPALCPPLLLPLSPHSLRKSPCVNHCPPSDSLKAVTLKSKMIELDNDFVDYRETPLPRRLAAAPLLTPSPPLHHNPVAVLADGLVLPEGCETAKIKVGTGQQDEYSSDEWSDDGSVSETAAARPRFDRLVAEMSGAIDELVRMLTEHPQNQVADSAARHALQTLPLQPPCQHLCTSRGVGGGRQSADPARCPLNHKTSPSAHEPTHENQPPRPCA